MQHTPRNKVMNVAWAGAVKAATGRTDFVGVVSWGFPRLKESARWGKDVARELEGEKKSELTLKPNKKSWEMVWTCLLQFPECSLGSLFCSTECFCPRVSHHKLGPDAYSYFSQVGFSKQKILYLRLYLLLFTYKVSKPTKKTQTFPDLRSSLQLTLISHNRSSPMAGCSSLDWDFYFFL